MAKRITKDDFRPDKPKRRRRKPMTEEQKAAAIERLAKAREARLKKNPPKLKHIHPDVLAKPDDDWLSYNKVKGWIKYNKDMIPSLNQEIRANQKGAIAKLESVKGYIRQMETYLKHGVWLSNFAGEDQNRKVVWECIVPAYDKEGNIKRQKGVFYKDLGFVWGEQDDDID